MTDEIETIPTSSGPGCRGVALYILSGVVSLFTAGMIGLYTLIFVNPQIPINLFPPATLPATAAWPTGTATSVLVLPPTWTPTLTSAPATGTAMLPPGTAVPSETPVVGLSATGTVVATATGSAAGSATPSPAATATATSSATPAPTASATVPSSATPSPSATVTATPYPLALSSSGVVAMQAPDPRGCSWSGIAGQVFRPNNGTPIVGLYIHLQGKWGAKTFNTNGTRDAFPDVLTGAAPTYGPGGFEIVLGTTPTASQGTLSIQVLDANGVALSAPVSLTTYATCAQNLLLANFNQVH